MVREKTLGQQKAEVMCDYVLIEYYGYAYGVASDGVEDCVKAFHYFFRPNGEQFFPNIQTSSYRAVETDAVITAFEADMIGD